MSLALRAVVGVGAGCVDGVGELNNLCRIRHRKLGSKFSDSGIGIGLGHTTILSPLGKPPPPPGNVRHLVDINRRITELKMNSNITGGHVIDLQPPVTRRDSGGSTASTYYGSMRSADMGSSRRSSQQSNSAGVGMAPSTAANLRQPGLHPAPGSLYDPISPGSSRRSSQLSQTSSTALQRIMLTRQNMHNPESNLVVQVSFYYIYITYFLFFK